MAKKSTLLQRFKKLNPTLFKDVRALLSAKQQLETEKADTSAELEAFLTEGEKLVAEIEAELKKGTV